MATFSPDTTERASSLPDASGSGGGRSSWLLRILQGPELVITAIAVALAVYFTLASPNFATTSNAGTLSQTIAPIVMLGVAEVFVLTLGEIDLSVGEVYVLAPFLVLYMDNAGIGVIPGIIVALIVSCLIGAINGFFTVKMRVPSFITTIGTTFAIMGIILISSDGSQKNTAGTGGTLASVLGHAIYSEIIWVLAAVVVLHLVLRKTTFGLHVVAAGGNEVAASEAGIRVTSVKIWAFVICSFLGGLMGVLDSYHIGSLDPSTIGLNLMFYGVTAAVIGGTALTGGRGTMIGALVGGVVLGILENGFNIVGISAYKFFLILGLAILAAMVLNIQLERLRTSDISRRGSMARVILRRSRVPKTTATEEEKR